MIYYKSRISIEKDKNDVLIYYPEFKKYWWSFWVRRSQGWKDVRHADIEIRVTLKIKTHKKIQ